MRAGVCLIFMSSELFVVLALLAACVGMFVVNKPRMDVVALLVIVIFPLTGIITLPEALAGFSDANIVLIAALFVIGAGLARTGIAYQLSDLLVKKAGDSETRLIVLLMAAVAGLGSVMSSTGVVAIFIPVALSLADRLRIPPGRLMMPLSFAGLMSGMLTLVATPPNIVVDNALTTAGYAGFSFFSFTPIGLVILAAGMGYMLFARHWLRSGESPDKTSHKKRRNLLDLIADYNLVGRAYRLRIRPESPLVGLSLVEVKKRYPSNASVVGIERRGKFGTDVLQPTAGTVFQAADVLLLDLPANPQDPRDKARELGLELLPLRGSYFTDQSRSVGMAEILLPPGSGLVGSTVEKHGFRTKHQLTVIGLRRGNVPQEGEIQAEKLRAGDTLLVIGSWDAVRRLQSQPRDFLVLSVPAEIDQVAPAQGQAPYALLSLGVMVVLMVTGVVPNLIAALIGCLLMGFFRCLDMESAYKSIHWPVLLLIVGVMPFATALDRTGGIDLVVDGLLGLVGKAGPRVVLASLFVLTAVIGLFISNTATAILMAPIALNTAYHQGASPYPFAMTVAIAASAAFMTPISSPVNTLVLGPGRYRFGDFVKVGVPFTFVVMLICVWLVPVIFPLYP
jgi:di/tricarboxylate transporter